MSMNVLSSGERVTFPVAPAVSAARPLYGLLPGPLASGWELRRYLPITIGADEDGWYVLSDNIFLVYGDGDTLPDAQRDYVASLIDYYRIVERDAHGGDDAAQKELARVQAYFGPRA